MKPCRSRIPGRGETLSTIHDHCCHNSTARPLREKPAECPASHIGKSMTTEQDGTCARLLSTGSGIACPCRTARGILMTNFHREQNQYEAASPHGRTDRT